MPDHVPGGDNSAKTYIHPLTLTDDEARALARICIRDQQSFAFVRDGRAWQAWCPLADKQRFIDHIETAKDK